MAIMMMILLFRLHSCHFLCLEFLHNLSIVDLLTFWMTTVWTMTMDGLSLGIAGSTMATMMIGSTLEESMMTAMRSMPVQNGLKMSVKILSFFTVCSEFKLSLF